jgi:hypothetical protein
VPASASPGDYTVEVTFDAGPLGGQLVARRRVRVQ